MTMLNCFLLLSILLCFVGQREVLLLRCYSFIVQEIQEFSVGFHLNKNICIMYKFMYKLL